MLFFLFPLPWMFLFYHFFRPGNGPITISLCSIFNFKTLKESLCTHFLSFSPEFFGTFKRVFFSQDTKKIVFLHFKIHKIEAIRGRRTGAVIAWDEDSKRLAGCEYPAIKREKMSDLAGKEYWIIKGLQLDWKSDQPFLY